MKRIYTVLMLISMSMGHTTQALNTPHADNGNDGDWELISPQAGDVSAQQAGQSWVPVAIASATAGAAVLAARLAASLKSYWAISANQSIISTIQTLLSDSWTELHDLQKMLSNVQTGKSTYNVQAIDEKLARLAGLNEQVRLLVMGLFRRNQDPTIMYQSIKDTVEAGLRRVNKTPKDIPAMIGITPEQLKTMSREEYIALLENKRLADSAEENQWQVRQLGPFKDLMMWEEFQAYLSGEQAAAALALSPAEQVQLEPLQEKWMAFTSELQDLQRLHTRLQTPAEALKRTVMAIEDKADQTAQAIETASAQTSARVEEAAQRTAARVKEAARRTVR